MKPSALQRLVTYARANKAFVRRLREDRKAALAELAKAGIKLSSKETALLNTILSSDRVFLTNEQVDMISGLRIPVGRARGDRPSFWPIFCFVVALWKPHARRKFSKDRGSVPKQLKA